MSIRESDETFGAWNLRSGTRCEAVNMLGPLSSNDGDCALSWAAGGPRILMRSECPTPANMAAKTRSFVDFIMMRPYPWCSGAAWPLDCCLSAQNATDAATLAIDERVGHVSAQRPPAPAHNLALLRGSMTILACVSGMASASNAPATPSSPTMPVTRAEASMVPSASMYKVLRNSSGS